MEWKIIMVSRSGLKRVAIRYETKEEAEEKLNKCFHKIKENVWEDDLGRRFYIEREVN